MPASPEKINLASLDVAADKRRLLRQLFPEAFTESTGAEGKPAELDFEKLKAVLGEHVELATPGQERYGLEWPGKRDALKAVQAPSLATLIPAPEESVDWETTQNVFIEGDNLEVLKLLQKSYYGKVKMIYIDPPYNTGNDFVYPDNYAESLDTYLRYTGKIDDQGFKTTTNSKDSGRFHSNWLRMMYPRLYVAKNLLREDGVIFMSIDDNEVSNLRHVCDQIFGEENFLAQVVWEKSRKNDAKFISVGHEYLVCYARSQAYLREKKIIWREEKPGAREIWEKFVELRQKHGMVREKIEKDLSSWFTDLPKSHPSKKWSRYKRVDETALGEIVTFHGQEVEVQDTMCFIQLPSCLAQCLNAGGFTRILRSCRLKLTPDLLNFARMIPNLHFERHTSSLFPKNWKVTGIQTKPKKRKTMKNLRHRSGGLTFTSSLKLA